MDAEAGERAMLCHLQLKCQLLLDKGCFFEAAGWIWGSELPGEGLQERRIRFGFLLSCTFQRTLSTLLRRKLKQQTPGGHW